MKEINRYIFDNSNNFQNNSNSTNFTFLSDIENTEKVRYSHLQLNNPKFELNSEENLNKIYPMKMSSQKLLNNSPKKIKDVRKPLDDFKHECEVNYPKDCEIQNGNSI